MIPLVEICNNQSRVMLSERFIKELGRMANLAVPDALAHGVNGGGVLEGLKWVEVSIVDDETIARVHHDFMGVSGPTDVITFGHGEIVISIETCQLNATEFGHSWQRELLLYSIHGLLHLAGHEDVESSERERMEEIQFNLLEKVSSTGEVYFTHK